MRRGQTTNFFEGFQDASQAFPRWLGLRLRRGNRWGLGLLQQELGLLLQQQGLAFSGQLLLGDGRELILQAVQTVMEARIELRQGSGSQHALCGRGEVLRIGRQVHSRAGGFERNMQMRPIARP